MRILKQKGPFKSIEIFFEDLPLQEIRQICKTHSHVTVLSHHSIDGISNFRLRQKKTPNIYVREGAEVVFSRFRDTVRNEIHRTERIDNFEVRLPDTDTDAVYEMYRLFEFAQKRAPISRLDFSQYICASAYVDGRPISAITFFQSGDVLRVRSIFSLRLNAKSLEDRELYKVIGFASKRLIYEICRYAILCAAKVVDLASINLIDPEKESIARFKSGFGAVIEDEYQYIYSSSFYTIAEKIVGLKVRLYVFVLSKLRSAE